MRSLHEGWHEWDSTARRGPGRSTASCCRMGDECLIPASRFQPKDVHGPSEVIDPASYAWADRGWSGDPWHDADAVMVECSGQDLRPEPVVRHRQTDESEPKA